MRRSGTTQDRRNDGDSSPMNEAGREWLRQALHDGLGQALTSISFLAGSLQQRLAAQGLPEANDAGEILSLTRQAISETQALVQDEPRITEPQAPSSPMR